MAEKFIEITFSPAKLFSLYIKGRDYKIKWVADSIDVSQSYVSMILSEKATLTKSIHEKLNELLETNY